MMFLVKKQRPCLVVVSLMLVTSSVAGVQHLTVAAGAGWLDEMRQGMLRAVNDTMALKISAQNTAINTTRFRSLPRNADINLLRCHARTKKLIGSCVV
ncbi:hypothetical protein BaRGS_00015519 [Batillaria attramentaria]|uniref:Secreted protein n=1 Tax=Batillaria attramentaria TaxID=370345 RepID=A0ABD0L290_9CAEN